MYTYVFMYVCPVLCVCVRERERARERVFKKIKKNKIPSKVFPSGMDVRNVTSVKKKFDQRKKQKPSKVFP